MTMGGKAVQIHVLTMREQCNKGSSFPVSMGSARPEATDKVCSEEPLSGTLLLHSQCRVEDHVGGQHCSSLKHTPLYMGMPMHYVP